MSQVDVTSALNEIVAVCRDDIEFYMQAAQTVDRPEISDLFLNMPDTRGETIGMLMPHVEAEGGSVTMSGTVAGKTHRLLSSLQARMTNDETKALVGQLEEAENRTIERLQEIMKQPLTDSISEIVQERLGVFQGTYSQMKALNNSFG